jgi:hypothetical protein
MLGRFHIFVLNTENDKVSHFKNIGQRESEDVARAFYWKEDYDDIQKWKHNHETYGKQAAIKMCDDCKI